MKKRSIFALSVLALLLAACASAARTPSPSSPSGATIEKAAPPLAMPSVGGDTSSSGPAQPQANAFDAAGSPADVPSRLVIQNAELTIVVDAPAQAMDSISKMAKDLRGFVVTSNIFKTVTDNGAEVPQANITIRVPSDKLDDALGQIRGLTKNPKEDVRSENRTGQDVTKEYVDQQSRLSNLEDTEKQLREIMASATRTEDVMSVFNQLSQVREQIELTKGQIKFYEESAALSAINIHIVAQESVAPLTIGGWKPGGVARDALQATVNGFKFIANILIWVVLFLLPILIVIGVPLWIVVTLVRRSRSKRKIASEPPAAS